MKKLLIVVGTRPNFIKVTQFKRVASEGGKVDVSIVHTGQHFDVAMADVFFDQFGLRPDHFLNIAAGSPASQIGNIIIALEKVTKELDPHMMMVVGDVNSTLAGAIVANKMNIPMAHLESGLRSGDRTMPEEINRILTDEVTDHYFITEQSGIDHLTAAGRSESRMHFVGNTMIDTLVAFEPQIQASKVLQEYSVQPDGFVLMTIHRPATVDNESGLNQLVDLMVNIAQHDAIVFPIHPRTSKNLERFGLMPRLDALSNVKLTGPLDYFAFQKLIASCRFILTDSGGIQEESTFRKVPCLTLRPNTERPSTIELGTNELVEFDGGGLQEAIDRIHRGEWKKGVIPPLWDGKATERVMKVLEQDL